MVISGRLIVHAPVSQADHLDATIDPMVAAVLETFAATAATATGLAASGDELASILHPTYKSEGGRCVYN